MVKLFNFLLILFGLCTNCFDQNSETNESFLIRASVEVLSVSEGSEMRGARAPESRYHARNVTIFID